MDILQRQGQFGYQEAECRQKPRARTATVPSGCGCAAAVPVLCLVKYVSRNNKLKNTMGKRKPRHFLSPSPTPDEATSVMQRAS